MAAIYLERKNRKFSRPQACVLLKCGLALHLIEIKKNFRNVSSYNASWDQNFIDVIGHSILETFQKTRAVSRFRKLSPKPLQMAVFGGDEQF